MYQTHFVNQLSGKHIELRQFENMEMEDPKFKTGRRSTDHTQSASSSIAFAPWMQRYNHTRHVDLVAVTEVYSPASEISGSVVSQV